MIDFNGMPQGLGMALSRSEKAMSTFSHLMKTRKKELLTFQKAYVQKLK